MSRKIEFFATEQKSDACVRPVASQCGFSLVEVMVAMVIGMLGIIVMMQMFSLFEGQKRTTAGGDDAISSGAVSLYGLQRTVQQSGWGINSQLLIGCKISGLLAGGASVPLVPVTINSSLIPNSINDANTDTLLVISGNGNGTVEGDNIDSIPSSGIYAVHTPTAFSVGDRVVAVPQTRAIPCNLVLTSVTAVASPTVTVSTGVASIVTGDDLFNLGSAPTVRVYAIIGGNLTVCDYTANDCATANASDTTVWVPVANNVVSLRAEYGRDITQPGMDAVADVWDQTRLWDQNSWTLGSVSSDVVKDTAACALFRASALRVALVARSSQPQKLLPSGAHVTPPTPTPTMTWTLLAWMGTDLVAHSINATEAESVAITLPNPDPVWPTWQDFRYKVFQTVIPVRNITTRGVVQTC